MFVRNTDLRLLTSQKREELNYIAGVSLEFFTDVSGLRQCPVQFIATCP